MHIFAEIHTRSFYTIAQMRNALIAILLSMELMTCCMVQMPLQG